jgi:hypothetical protein
LHIDFLLPSLDRTPLSSFADIGLSTLPQRDESAADAFKRLTDSRIALQDTLGSTLPAVSEPAVRQAQARQKKATAGIPDGPVESSIESFLKLFHTHDAAMRAYMLAYKLPGDTYTCVVGGKHIRLTSNDFFYICTSAAHLRSFLRCAVIAFDHCYKIVRTNPDGCIVAITGVTASGDISCLVAIAFLSSSRGDLTSVVGDIIRVACEKLAAAEGVEWTGPTIGLHDVRHSDYVAMRLPFSSLKEEDLCAYHYVALLAKHINACVDHVVSPRLLDRMSLPSSDPHKLTLAAALKLERLEVMATLGGVLLSSSKDVFATVLISRVAGYFAAFPKMRNWLTGPIYNDVTSSAFCFRVDRASRACDAICELIQRSLKANGTMMNDTGIVVSMMHVLNASAGSKQRAVQRQQSGNYQRLKGTCGTCRLS